MNWNVQTSRTYGFNSDILNLNLLKKIFNNLLIYILLRKNYSFCNIITKHKIRTIFTPYIKITQLPISKDYRDFETCKNKYLSIYKSYQPTDVVVFINRYPVMYV